MLADEMRLLPKQKLIGTLIFLALLILVLLRLQMFFDANRFHEEFRILYHFGSAGINAKDYSGQFLEQFPQPLLYAWITRCAVSLGIGLEQYHRLLGAVCYLLFLSGIAITGLRIGALSALTATAFAAAQIIFFEQISSATPHAFAFPLLAWMLVALLYDRLFLGALLTIFAGLLYVPAAPIVGLMFAVHLVILRKGLANNNARRFTNLIYLSIITMVTLALVVQQLQPIEGYGNPLAPGERSTEFPENGSSGRYALSVFEPVNHVVSAFLGQFNVAVPPALVLTMFALTGALSGIGFYNLRSSPDLLNPILAFVLPSVLLFGFVFMLRPYISYRFALYPLFTIIPFLLVYGLRQLLSRGQQLEGRSLNAYFIVIMIFLVSMGSASEHETFGGIELADVDQEVLDFLRTTPEDTLIAAWPTQTLPSLIPYLTGRALFVDVKAHYPSHEQHLLEMRSRMFDLIDAYFAISPRELLVLRCKRRVDYVLLDKRSLGNGYDSLNYFAPFDARIRDLRDATVGKGRVLASPPVQSIVFNSGQYVVIDLEFFSAKYGCEQLASVPGPGEPSVQR